MAEDFRVKEKKISASNCQGSEEPPLSSSNDSDEGREVIRAASSQSDTAAMADVRSKSAGLNFQESMGGVADQKEFISGFSWDNFDTPVLGTCQSTSF